MRSHRGSGGGLELPSSWTKVWSIWINRYGPLSLFSIFDGSKWAEETTTRQLKLNVRTCLCRRIQSCKRWKLTWHFSSRFMRRPANSPLRTTSVNHRRRAGSSSARGRRRKWGIYRRPCSSTGSRVSATHLASQPVKTEVSDTAAPYR